MPRLALLGKQSRTACMSVNAFVRRFFCFSLGLASNSPCCPLKPPPREKTPDKRKKSDDGQCSIKSVVQYEKSHVIHLGAPYTVVFSQVRRGNATIGMIMEPNPVPLGVSRRVNGGRARGEEKRVGMGCVHLQQLSLRASTASPR